MHKDFISDLQAVIDKVKGGEMSIIGDEKSFLRYLCSKSYAN